MIKVSVPAAVLLQALVTLGQDALYSQKQRAYDQFALPSDVAAQQ
jgi:hypothetical protein